MAIADGRTTLEKVRDRSNRSSKISHAKQSAVQRTEPEPPWRPLADGERRRLSKAEKRAEACAAKIKADWLADHPGKTVEDYELAGSCCDTDEGIAERHEWSKKRYGGRSPLDTPPGPMSEAEDQETEAAEDPAGFVVAVIKNARESADRRP
jgi:hypothetical protein